MGGSDGRLASAQTALMLQEETIRRCEREKKGLSEKVIVLERNSTNSEGDRRKLLDRINKHKAAETRMDAELKRQKETLDIAEQKQTETEVKRRKLEGELQRMKLTVHDKETEVQVMKERCDSLTKQLHTAESKCQNLQTSIERLSAGLAKTTEGEEQLRKRVNDL